MPGVVDWIHSPLPIVDKFFKECSVQEYGGKIEEFFIDLIEKNEDRIQRFHEGIQTIPSGSIVRVRCMIQDMFEPELYLEAFDLRNSEGSSKRCCGKYRDLTSCADNEGINFESATNVYGDRKVYYCIPVPCENDWNQRKPMSDAAVGTGSLESSSETAKRPLDENEDSEPMDTSSEDPSTDAAQSGGKKAKVSTAGETVTVNGCKNENPHLPIEGDKRLCCLLKTYSSSDNLLLNEVVEVYGILSADPLLTAINSDIEMNVEGFKEEHQAHHPSASQVPRIHVLKVTRAKSLNQKIPLDMSGEHPLVGELRSKAVASRASLLRALNACVDGDSLAAEFLLCHLLATVKFCNEEDVIGKFSVNLYKCAPTQISKLCELIKQIKPASHILPMTLENLNRQPYSPAKDYSTNILRSGFLQLPAGLHLTINETQLQEGQLNEQGTKNVVALGNLIKWQKVSYDFTYYQKDFQCTPNVLVVSEGKSMLPSDVRLPWHGPSVNQDAGDGPAQIDVCKLFSASELEDVRLYLAVAPFFPYTLSSEMQTVLQEHFVSARRESPESMTPEDFTSLLNLSKLLTLSYGEESLTQEIFAKAMEFHAQRKLRLS